MKYIEKQIGAGQWAVHSGKRYFTKTVCETREEAHIQALYMSSAWHGKQQDIIHEELDKLGLIDQHDLFGYKA